MQVRSSRFKSMWHKIRVPELISQSLPPAPSRWVTSNATLRQLGWGWDTSLKMKDNHLGGDTPYWTLPNLLRMVWFKSASYSCSHSLKPFKCPVQGDLIKVNLAAGKVGAAHPVPRHFCWLEAGFRASWKRSASRCISWGADGRSYISAPAVICAKYVSISI